MTVLGIDTSCDETAAAVLSDGRSILSNVVASQLIHSEFGGVVPEYASRAHIRAIQPVKSPTLRSNVKTAQSCSTIWYCVQPV